MSSPKLPHEPIESGRSLSPSPHALGQPWREQADSDFPRSSSPMRLPRPGSPDFGFTASMASTLVSTGTQFGLTGEIPSKKKRQKLEEAEESMAVRPECEADLQDQFRRILIMVEAGLESKTAALHPHLAVECEFEYKKRQCKGGPIHLAALYRDSAAEPPDRDSARLVEVLVTRFQADVHDECTYQSYKDVGKCMALHLAAGRGNVEVVKMLLQLGADVDATNKINDRANQTPLFEAACFYQESAMQVLIDGRADVDAQNMHKATCLHNAAKQGQERIAKILVEAEARLDIQNSQHEIPLEVAVKCARLPRKKLYLFSRRRIEDVLMVAKHSAKAAADMMKDSKKSRESGTDIVHESWQEVLTASSDSRFDEDEGTPDNKRLVDKWVRLMLEAPRAAVQLLGAATREPKVEEVNRHPLPKRAKIHFRENMRCWYTTDATWEFDGETASIDQRIPAWHRRFCAGAEMAKLKLQRSRTWNLLSYWSSILGIAHNTVNTVVADIQDSSLEYKASKELVNVNILSVRLPNLIDPRVMYALSSTERLGVFATMPVQAIVNCAWKGCAKKFYWLNTCYKLVELSIMLSWVMAPDRMRHDFFFLRVSWSFAFAIAFRDVVAECHEIAGYVSLDELRWYLKNPRNFLDYIALGTQFFLLLSADEHFDVTAYPQCLCGVSIYRWVLVLLNFRAASGLGQQILPLVHSLHSMIGIFFLISMFFMTFLHGFAALELRKPAGEEDNLNVFLGTFGLLLVGDGGGIETILQLGGADAQGDVLTRMLYVVSVIVFCLVLVNLFIAVHGEAYSTAHERTEAAFLQERAAICLQCLLRPCWPPTIFGHQVLPKQFFHLRYAKLIAHAIAFVLFGIACFAITFDKPHVPVVAAFIGVTGMVYYDILILQRPWAKIRKDIDKDHYLWICVRADHDPSAIAPNECRGEKDSEEPGAEQAGSSLSMLRSMNNALYRNLSRQVASMQKNFSKDMKGCTDKQITETQRQLGDLSSRMERLEENVNLLVSNLLPGMPVQPVLPSAELQPSQNAAQSSRTMSGDLHAFLQRLNLLQYWSTLRDKLGAVTVADLFAMEDADMQEAGLKTLEQKRLRQALAEYKRSPSKQRHNTWPVDMLAAVGLAGEEIPPPPPPPYPPPSEPPSPASTKLASTI